MDNYLNNLKYSWDLYIQAAATVSQSKIGDVQAAVATAMDAKATFDSAKRDFLLRLSKLGGKLLQYGETGARTTTNFTNPATAYPSAAQSTTALLATSGTPVGVTGRNITNSYQMENSGYAPKPQSYGPYGVPEGYAMNKMSGANLLSGSSVAHPRSSTGLGTRRNMLTGVDPRRQPQVNMSVDPLASYTPNNNPLIQGI
jgi:hypothetical protein